MLQHITTQETGMQAICGEWHPNPGEGPVCPRCFEKYVDSLDEAFFAMKWRLAAHEWNSAAPEDFDGLSEAIQDAWLERAQRILEGAEA